MKLAEDLSLRYDDISLFFFVLFQLLTQADLFFKCCFPSFICIDF